ncbi:Gfo/Idh/MocA family protein [Cohnella hashimotonis]|uniref:Gfo/Idh/MocA family oxidoreductase n=1 Tax=Cohnella hashimotonis TaxID=2826895 RepID=A0ABT6TVU0_9BACL|nr:Gfo/Idh/MocA family oxidoreductase [Cohnella hashimotonis]MDI4650079.1 Gfo/Idh/MocA family oxidoreductase [Cohnella hashimotonis]
MNIGIIGIGVIGLRHIGNLVKRDDVRIAAVCGTDADKTARIAGEYGAEPFTDYRLLFERTPLDAVFVCTPPGVRKGPIHEAAQRGIACFVEKPPARSVSEAEEIAAIVRESGIVCAVGFMYRYAGAVAAARELIARSGAPVPIVRSVHACAAGLPEAPTPRWLLDKAKSGGPMFDQAIHLIDAARYIAGAQGGEVEAIHAFGANVQRPKSADYTVEDNFVVNLAYAHGTVQTHTHSWGVERPRVEIELLGRDYRLTVDLSRLGSRLYGDFRGEEVSAHFPEENMYVDEAAAFLEAARSGDPSGIRSSYADAARSLELVVRANESADEGRAIRL